MTSGVYRIRNSVTDHSYIGASSQIETRWEQHRSALSKGKHYNKRMQTDWRKYGSAAFEFSILEAEVDWEQLWTREQHYVAALKADRGQLEYNIHDKGGGGFPRHRIERLNSHHLQLHFSPVEAMMLASIGKYRYPNAIRATQAVIPELIREEYARLLARGELHAGDKENAAPGV